ncbi:hypothetical protein LTR62_006610 [Meristemomyces frigidus]|uniref:RNA ligase/cyclic nucleotide phosphodiesterase n=1 Tax=Meristemomyces frigidus TaxID=1508187 RepID=A0AAN7TMI5_9PEZI|nr:hypothetical protein LTR62_006610 [Meristemomyces frigidus]
MAAYYTFQDLSGGQQTLSTTASSNPYVGLIEACNDDPSVIQARYNTHRTTRNAQQRDRLLSFEFPGVTVDEILARLEDPTIEPGFKDWRHCLVFWARPPEGVRKLIAEIQRRVLTVAPHTWIMPPPNLHMTALEITHSLTAPEIDDLVKQMLPGLSDMVDYTYDHRARLIMPLLSYDAQALALSFLPAAGEGGRSAQKDEYSYHHLRRDLFDKATATGVKVASRYVIPSAHLTIARFVTKRDFETAGGEVDHAKVRQLIEMMDGINEWLKIEFWPQSGKIEPGGEWIVGEGVGLECRKGALWYGSDGETVKLGQGF